MNARFSHNVQVGASNLEFLPHALKRMQKRVISEELVIFIATHGVRTYSYGDHRYTFSGKNKHIDVPKRLQEKLRHHPYVIVDDDKIITAAWCYKKVKRNSNRRRRGQWRR